MAFRQQNSTAYPIEFTLRSAIDGSPVCGASLTGYVAISKSGSTSWGAPAGTVTELSIASPTWAAAPFTNPQTSGGVLSGGATYSYVIISVNPNGRTLPGANLTYAVPAGTNTNSVTLNWNAVAGAAGYLIARGGPGTELLLASVSAPATTYTDNSSTTPAGALPTVNTTSGGVYALAGDASDRDTLGTLTLRAFPPTAIPTTATVDIVPWNPFDGANLGLTEMGSSHFDPTAIVPMRNQDGVTQPTYNDCFQGAHAVAFEPAGVNSPVAPSVFFVYMPGGGVARTFVLANDVNGDPVSRS